MTFAAGVTPFSRFEGMTMSSIFVSHRNSDVEEAEYIASRLRERGHDVWLDAWTIDIGDSIVERMNEGLSGSTFLVLCFSSEGSLSPWMSREWFSSLARQLNGENVKLIPVLLKGGEVPAILADIKYADAAKGLDSAVSAVIQAIEQI